VLAADCLKAILNKTMNSSVMTPPLPRNANPDFPVIQYADDTLIIVKADAPQLIYLKG
jgi:hypothetical protein